MPVVKIPRSHVSGCGQRSLVEDVLKCENVNTLLLKVIGDRMFA